MAGDVPDPRSLPHLRDAAARLNVPLDETSIERFRRYRDLLLAANEQFNLTRVTDPAEVEIRLFADSLALLPLVPDAAERLLDIGSGGGVPGLALAIVRPTLEVVLLDATAKKVRFLAETARALNLEHVTAIHGRAEELARDTRHRERYTAVTARAVARLATLAELTLPFLQPGGVAILPKGGGAAEELAEARYAIDVLGGRARPLVHPPLEGTTIAVIDKLRPTPVEFPRRTGVPSKSPLYGPGNPRL
jgi:16S rRNA (guanine527-N7)-methyltransferase